MKSKMFAIMFLMIGVLVSGCGGGGGPEDTPAVARNPIINICNSVNKAFFNPSIAIENFTVVIACENDGQIYFVRSFDEGVNFSSPVNISNSLNKATEPTIVIKNSIVLGVWKEDGQIYLSRSVNGGVNFSSPVNISNSVNGTLNPSVAIEDLIVIITWEEDDGRSKYIRSINGGISFSSPVNISTSIGALNPFVAMFGDLVVFVWEEKVGEIGQIKFSSSFDRGENFFSPSNITNSESGAFNPSVVIENSTVVFVYEDDDGEIYLGKSINGGGSFSSAVNISASEEIPDFNPSIAIKKSIVAITWQEEGEDKLIKFSQSIDEGINFSSPVNISSNIDLSSNISIAIGSFGPVVVWSGVGGAIFAQRQ